MATLVKPKPVAEAVPVSSHLSDSAVPTPFPIEQLAEFSSKAEELRTAVDDDPTVVAENTLDAVPQVNSSVTNDDEANGALSPTTALKEVMPSIVHVQSSCLMTLNNLLFPSFSLSSALNQPFGTSNSPPLPLQALVSNLRSHPAFQGEMIESVVPRGDLSEASETELLRELRLRVETIASGSPDAVSKADLVLAAALVHLLTNLNRLSEIHALNGVIAANSPLVTPRQDSPPGVDVFSTLTRQLNDFQLERRFSSTSIEPSLSISKDGRTRTSMTPVLAVEEGLLWNQIEGDLEKVVKMCKERVVEHHTSHPQHLGLQQLPPEYNLEDYEDLDDLETLPDYDLGGRSSFSYDDKDAKSLRGGKSAATASIMSGATHVTDEKRRMDLEAVALAIDRLYAVAPQLHNQRVELKKDKVREMARASSSASASASGSRTTGSSSKTSKMLGEGIGKVNEKGKERDVRDLERMMEMIGRASERSMRDQSVILDGELGMQKKLDRAKQKENAKRDAFVDQLIQRSSAGRLHNQDVVLQHLRVKSTDRIKERDPEALLSLPEFMREPLPPSQRQRMMALDVEGDLDEEQSETQDDDDLDAAIEHHRQLETEGEVMLTLPEFVKEPIPPYLSNRMKNTKRRSAASGSSSAMPYSEGFGFDEGSEEGAGAPLSRTSSSGKEDKKKDKKEKSRSGSKEKGKKDKGDKDKKRSRSLSAPPLRLSWLRSSPSTSGLAAAAAAAVGSSRHNRNGSTAEGKDKERKGKSKNQGFEIVYVAEHHENLHHILTFFTINSNTSSATHGSGHPPKSKPVELPGPVEVEILPPLNLVSTASNGLSSPVFAGDHLIIKSGPHVSLPLLLPAHTPPGKHQARQLGGHFEVKLGTKTPSTPTNGARASSSSSSTSSAEVDQRASQPSSQTTSQSHAHQTEAGSSPLLDATQLDAMKPTSFICASCSLPLVMSSKVDVYRDLPSEHWEELVEAWMCHADQNLSDQVKKFTGKGGENAGRGGSEVRGFWPERGQGLVGGSYVLFEESVINRGNLFIGSEIKHDESWRLARCICGALIGRCQERDTEAGPATVYRVLKYAIRPVSPGSEPLKIPLSAFVVEDMMEFVQAHATYRFVIRDDEDEKPRILVWLFKPRIRLAYTAPRHHAIPKSASIIAAKVLYKLLSPEEQNSDIKSILNLYPGFPQAEYLSYPMYICRHIAALLNDSNSAYPEALRQMTGLKVGWLQRT